MKTLYLERSAGGCRGGDWVEELDLDGVARIVVGTGPGSFAGIRSALAFAQGFALGRKCEVLGLPSACAVAAAVLADGERRDSGRLAVLGDARQGKTWVALFDGFRLEREVFQVDDADAEAAVPDGRPVVTPDASRIGERLKALFGDRYLGGRAPTSDGLRAFAEKAPQALRPEPLPIYLNPAVRDRARDGRKPATRKETT